MPTSVWRGHISFGLVSIPVRLFRAARAERVKLREVYSVTPESAAESELAEIVQPPRKGPTPIERRTEIVEESAPAIVAPVRRAVLDQGGQQVPQAAVTKGYEVERGRFVTLDRDELRALVPKTSTTMELVEFVSLSSVDPVFFETSYYVQPEPAGEKPYALLYSSLEETGLVGVAQIAMHRREHIVLVRPGKSGLIAHTMYLVSEVRADHEYHVDTALVNRKELDLANKLVSALAAEFEPEKFRYTYREQLEKMIEAKAAGQKIHAVHAPAPGKAAGDIMKALQESLAGLKKPPEREAERPAKPRRKRG
jgi:DNA end-binding protein Ku